MIRPSEGTGGCTITMKTGTKVKIVVPFDKIKGQSWFASQETKRFFNGKPRDDLVRGFLSENTDVGIITPTDNNEELAVIYQHLRDAENRIWFFAATGETAVCDITRIPIHDHATISQGGPAYATYWSDNIETSQDKQEQ